jgi:hypothetical protein
MKKYIFTESQIKTIINKQINEQTSENYEGVISTDKKSGKRIVIATSEMGNKKVFPITLKVNVSDNTGVFVDVNGNQVSVWGKDPKNPKGPNIKYN